MAWADSREITLHAVLYEIECGLFCVTYRRGTSDLTLRGLPIYQLGHSEAEARQRLERSARALGYQAIVWDETDTSPSPGGLGMAGTTVFQTAPPPSRATLPARMRDAHRPDPARQPHPTVIAYANW